MTRVVIENVQPEIEEGVYAAKATVGDDFLVSADIFADGHDVISARVRSRHESNTDWQETSLEPMGNDVWQGTFPVTELGTYLFSVTAWIDAFKTWASQLERRIAADQDIGVDLLIGAEIVTSAAKRAKRPDAKRLTEIATRLSDKDSSQDERATIALSEALQELMESWPDRSAAANYEREMPVTADRELARFSSWYEMFPRSASTRPGKHATFRECEARLPYVAEMGFNVLYLPPIHPVGVVNRKGKNNALKAPKSDTGSPWAIGSAEGGHRDVNPQLGTLEDFCHFVEKAREFNIEVALDIAFQCAPDHPYITDHPEWFRKRPDGTIQFAENPPKKYEDIVPFDFDCEDRDALFDELTDVVRYWVQQGVKVFRVDNPHTKPFELWDRLISTLKSEEPELIFLAEAFTRPRVTYRLAKLGFTQSYTYFAWRNTKSEITEYLTTLFEPPVSDFFRPNFWPNTPDILTEYLQTGTRSAFMVRLLLAATLGASYGIYGPAFELQEAVPREPGSEEYLDSEKYQLRQWDIDRPDSLKDFIARVNMIRRENAALQHNHGLKFYETDNPQVICYSKTDPRGESTVLTVVNLDPHHTQTTFVDTWSLKSGEDPERPYQMHDLLTGARYLWQGDRNYVELNPQSSPAHIFAIRRYVRTERDFDYFL